MATTPRTRRADKSHQVPPVPDLGLSNLGGDDDEDAPLEFRTPGGAVAQRSGNEMTMAELRAMPQVKIMLHDNDDIPPGGQFIGINGIGFMLRANEKVMVPEPLCEILDNAVKSIPVKDANDTVVGYRDVLRFPYSLVR